LQPGLFVVFEGPEGASKGTQSQLFADYLQDKKIPYIHTREPDGPIRSVLLDPANTGMIHDDTEVLLYAASRVNKFLTEIKPALEEGKVVVCDRYLESSLAYQGYAGGVDLAKILSIHDAFINDSRVTLLFDISYETSRKRLGTRGEALDRLEMKSEVYHRKVIDGYRKLAKDYSHIKRIDANQTIDQVHSEVLSLLTPLLEERGML